MICPECAGAGDLTVAPAPLPEAVHALAVEGHARCAGCECQHQVVPVEVIAARRAAMPRGGLARIVGAA